MERKDYETLYMQIFVLEKDVLTFSAEPEDEKIAGDIFGD